MTNGAEGYLGRIQRDRAIMAGKPVVAGTRIPVAIVLGFLAERPDLDELFAAYPRLTLADVQVCLASARATTELHTLNGRSQHSQGGRC